jgi:hypothetical protein
MKPEKEKIQPWEIRIIFLKTMKILEFTRYIKKRI